MEFNEVTIEKLLNEYNKYILSRVINKEYNFDNLREMVKKFSIDTQLIEYKETYTNYEVAKTIQNFIRKECKGNQFNIE